MEPAKFGPVGLEALDDTFIDYMKQKGLHPPDMNFMPEGQAWLLVEFGGERQSRKPTRRRASAWTISRNATIRPSMKLFDDPAQEKLVWHLREEGLGATAKVPDMPDNHEGWEDSSVPPDRAGRLPARFQKADGHVSDTWVRCTAISGKAAFTRGLRSICRRQRVFRSCADFLEEASDLVVRYGGSLSGEHGDGQARGELLARMFSPEIDRRIS